MLLPKLSIFSCFLSCYIHAENTCEKTYFTRIIICYSQSVSIPLHPHHDWVFYVFFTKLSILVTLSWLVFRRRDMPCSCDCKGWYCLISLVVESITGHFEYKKYLWIAIYILFCPLPTRDYKGMTNDKFGLNVYKESVCQASFSCLELTWFIIHAVFMCCSHVCIVAYGLMLLC